MVGGRFLMPINVWSDNTVTKIRYNFTNMPSAEAQIFNWSGSNFTSVRIFNMRAYMLDGTNGSGQDSFNRIYLGVYGDASNPYAKFWRFNGLKIWRGQVHQLVNKNNPIHITTASDYANTGLNNNWRMMGYKVGNENIQLEWTEEWYG